MNDFLEFTFLKYHRHSPQPFNMNHSACAKANTSNFS